MRIIFGRKFDFKPIALFPWMTIQLESSLTTGFLFKIAQVDTIFAVRALFGPCPIPDSVIFISSTDVSVCVCAWICAFCMQQQQNSERMCYNQATYRNVTQIIYMWSGCHVAWWPNGRHSRLQRSRQTENEKFPFNWFVHSIRWLVRRVEGHLLYMLSVCLLFIWNFVTYKIDSKNAIRLFVNSTSLNLLFGAQCV